MSAPVIDGARQSIQAPGRARRPYGLFSVATPATTADAHWIYGGVTADGEECSQPQWGVIGCGPSANKTSRSWYSDLDGDPWLTYMYETCKTVGRYSEAAARLRARFEAAEESAAEAGLANNVLADAELLTPTVPTTAGAIGALEADAARYYGGRVTIYLSAESLADSPTYFVRVGDHLETLAGSLVSVGNYGDMGKIFASGALALYRSELTIAGPVTGSLYTLPDSQGFNRTNDYYVLAERAYIGVVDCWAAQVNIGGGE